MNTLELLYKSKKQLKGISFNPYQESLWILEEVLNLTSSEIYSKIKNINKKQQRLYFDTIQRRRQGEPLEHLLKEKFFFKKKFYLERGVFIPRQETETLIHWILNNIQKTDFKAVDFGAGAGPICLTLLSHFPDCSFVALEISSKSVKCLKQNSKTFQVEKRLKILQKDVCQTEDSEWKPFLGASPSLITANPPYISPTDKSISRNVYFFEPPLALFSNKEGMGHITSWFKKAMSILSSKGIYIFEFGWNQLNKVKSFCNKQKELRLYEIHKDSAGIPRIAVCFKK